MKRTKPKRVPMGHFSRRLAKQDREQRLNEALTIANGTTSFLSQELNEAREALRMIHEMLPALTVAKAPELHMSLERPLDRRDRPIQFMPQERSGPSVYDASSIPLTFTPAETVRLVTSVEHMLNPEAVHFYVSFAGKELIYHMGEGALHSIRRGHLQSILQKEIAKSLAKKLADELKEQP